MAEPLAEQTFPERRGGVAEKLMQRSVRCTVVRILKDVQVAKSLAVKDKWCCLAYGIIGMEVAKGKELGVKFELKQFGYKICVALFSVINGFDTI